MVTKSERFDPFYLVSCHFYIRTEAEKGLYKYDSVTLSNPEGSGVLMTLHPPFVGDLISLWDSLKKTGGQFRVLERSWMNSSWGSSNWPYIEGLPTVGPHLDIIVERTEGLFRDEVPLSPEDDEREL